MCPRRSIASSLFDADRFVAEVAAGGDDGEIELAQQQVMQRRVGQHHAQGGVAGGDIVGDGRIGLAGQQHDGRLATMSAAVSASGSISTRVRACARSRAMMRQGLVSGGACDPAAVAMASALRASHIRWKPPRPLTATIWPVRRAAAVRRRAACCVLRGPWSVLRSLNSV